jgi:signal transduction histidine kinase
LFVYDPENREFKTGIRKGKVETPPSIPSNTGATGRIATSQEAEFVEDTEQHSDIDSIVIEGQQMRAFAGVPLVTKRESVGVLYVNFFEPRRFSVQERELIGLLANQAATAIENASLYQQLEDKIIELERAQGEIADKERALVITTMTADFTHRVNNLAGTIPNWAKMAIKRLHSKDEPDERLIRYLKRISKESRFLLQEAKRLNQPLPAPEEVDVKGLVDSILGQMEITVSPEIDFVLESEPDLPPVCAIKQHLSDAIFNIVDNGAKAITGEGQVTIRVKRDPDRPERYLKVEISDTGSGIPEDKIPKIFELGETYRAGGTGYGLWRARNIVEGFGGSVQLEETSKKGSTFSIVLPIDNWSGG